MGNLLWQLRYRAVENATVSLKMDTKVKDDIYMVYASRG